MRAKILVFSQADLIKRLGLPEDAVISKIQEDFFSGGFNIVVHSKEYSLVDSHNHMVSERVY